MKRKTHTSKPSEVIDLKNLKKIEDFIIKELNVNLSDAAIFKHDDTTYELFNRYTIKKVSDYKYLVMTASEQKTFSFLKNAVMWCTFKKRDKFYEMLRIEELDMMLSGIDMMIEQHKKLVYNTQDLDNKLIYIAKLNEDKLKKQSITNELKNYIYDAKHWQFKRFAATNKSFSK